MEENTKIPGSWITIQKSFTSFPRPKSHAYMVVVRAQEAVFPRCAKHGERCEHDELSQCDCCGCWFCISADTGVLSGEFCKNCQKLSPEIRGLVIEFREKLEKLL